MTERKEQRTLQGGVVTLCRTLSRDLVEAALLIRFLMAGNIILKTGTCELCFDEVENCLSGLCGEGCTGQVCQGCLKAHVKSIHDSAYTGASTPIKCCFHPNHVVPISTWGKLFADKKENYIINAHNRRAAATLSLQCSGCHSRYTVFSCLQISRAEPY